MRCTGLKKYMPQKFCGRFSPLASKVMGNGRGVAGEQASSPILGFGFSQYRGFLRVLDHTASTTRSTWPDAPLDS